ncbi:MAG: hypothetical protein WD069_19040 [Planctomycetales bacterium]
MTHIRPVPATIARLRRQLREWERSRGTPSPAATGRPAAVERSGATEVEAAERLFPGGCRAGSLVEWLAEGEGTGAATLALSCVETFLRNGGGRLIVVDDGDGGCGFHPPGLPPAIDPERIVVVRPRSVPDAWWVVEQSLRCRGVAVTLCRVRRADDRTLRRWQLAAEHGGGIGLLLRPSAARRGPSWADVRWLVEPLPCLSESHGRRWRLELLHCRGGTTLRAAPPGSAVELEQDHETGAVRVVSRLAAAETDCRAARA